MQFTILLALVAFLTTVLSAPLTWKPDPGMCALCPAAFLENWRSPRTDWLNYFADEKGLCAGHDDGWKKPSDEYQHRCLHLLGPQPPMTIRGPPWGDGAVPLASYDKNHVWGPNIPAKFFTACGVNGTHFQGKPLLDAKCLRRALDVQEDYWVKKIEPCVPCPEVHDDPTDPFKLKYQPPKPACWGCCTKNQTVDRVCWLKDYHPFRTVLDCKVEAAPAANGRWEPRDNCQVVGGDAEPGAPRNSRIPQEWRDDDPIFDPFPPPLDRPVDKPSKIAKRQWLLPPTTVDPPATDCGNWTEPSGEQHAIPICACERLYTEVYGYEPLRPSPFSDGTCPLLPEHGRRPLSTLQSPYHAAAIEPMRCGDWVEPGVEQHPIPSRFCMEWMVDLIEEFDPVLHCDPISAICTDTEATLELQRCGDWTRALGVQPPTDVAECFSWVGKYKKWENCLGQRRPWWDNEPRTCTTPAFLLDDRGNSSSNATGNESKILPRDASWPPEPMVRHSRFAHCGNWTDFLNATHRIPKRVCRKFNLKLVNTMYPLPPFPDRLPPTDAAEAPGDVSVIDGETEILPRDTQAAPPADPVEFAVTHCGNWTDFRNGTHPIPGKICRELNHDLLLFVPPFPFPGPVAYGEHPRGPIGVAENEDKLEILPRDEPPLNETRMLEEEANSELERCRDWTQSLGARIPNSVEQCHAWQHEYYQWENCKSEPWLTPFPELMCPTPSFFYDDDGNILETALQKVIDILPRDAPGALPPSEGSAYRCQDKDGNWHRHFGQCLDHSSGRLSGVCQDQDGQWHSHIKYCRNPLGSSHEDKDGHEHHGPAHASRSLPWSCTRIVDGKRVAGRRLPDGGCDLEIYAPHMAMPIEEVPEPAVYEDATHDPHIAMPIEEVPGPTVYEEEEKHEDADPFTRPPMPYTEHRHDFIPMIKFPGEEDKPHTLPEDAAESDS